MPKVIRDRVYLLLGKTLQYIKENFLTHRTVHLILYFSAVFLITVPMVVTVAPLG